jgi:hypothetical protein
VSGVRTPTHTYNNACPCQLSYAHEDEQLSSLPALVYKNVVTLVYMTIYILTQQNASGKRPNIHIIM